MAPTRWVMAFHAVESFADGSGRGLALSCCPISPEPQQTTDGSRARTRVDGRSAFVSAEDVSLATDALLGNGFQTMSG